MSALDLHFSRRSTAVIVTLNGDLNGGTAELFNQFLTEHLLESDQTVILDATNLQFVNAAGLREFLKLARRLGNAKARLAGATSSVAMAIEIAGFNPLFHQYPTLAMAINPELNQVPKGLFSQFIT